MANLTGGGMGPMGASSAQVSHSAGGADISGPSSSNNGPKANGSNNTGTPYGGKKTGPKALIPPTSVHHDGNAPDGSPASSIPEPSPDLSLLAGPQGLPQRRPLINPSLPTAGAYGQITGYSGVN